MPHAIDRAMIRHALLLTAGLGMRLRPLTDVRAKPAIPVAGEPMVRRIIGWLASSGIDDLVLNLHHLPDTLTAAVGDGGDLGVRVRYSWEQPRILGSAGGPRLARPLLGADRFWIVNGDTLTDLDLAALQDAHVASGARVTLALVPNREFLRYGGVQLDATHRVTGFTARGPSAEGSYHYIGVQLVDGTVFDVVAAGDAARSIGGIYDTLIAAQPDAIHGFVSAASFFDVGTPADYWRTSQAFAPPAAAGATPSPSLGRHARVDPTARITRSILWDDVQVGRDAVLDECVVTDGVIVPAGSVHSRAVLVRGEDDQLLAMPLNLER
jgi:NDP-sugar pyrophosphorylase family protein